MERFEHLSIAALRVRLERHRALIIAVDGLIGSRHRYGLGQAHRGPWSGRPLPPREIREPNRYKLGTCTLVSRFEPQ